MFLTSFAKALLAVSLCLAVQGQSPPSGPKDLLAYIEREGAETVVKQLTSGDESEWHRVIRKIDMGTPAWLEVANAPKSSNPVGMAGGHIDQIRFADFTRPKTDG